MATCGLRVKVFRINLRDAEDLLIYDVQQIEASISQRILTPLNQNQHDAIVSFVFNISPGQFADSDVLRLLNAGEHLFAANAMEAWRMARIGSKLEVIDALVRRRAIEKALFLEHPEGRSVAPTPLVTPEFDPAWKRGEVTNETFDDTPAQTSKTEEDAFVDLVSTNIAAIAKKMKRRMMVMQFQKRKKFAHACQKFWNGKRQR